MLKQDKMYKAVFFYQKIAVVSLKCEVLLCLTELSVNFCLFDLILMSHQHFFSYKEMGLLGLNQY